MEFKRNSEGVLVQFFLSIPLRAIFKIPTVKVEKQWLYRMFFFVFTIFKVGIFQKAVELFKHSDRYAAEFQ